MILLVLLAVVSSAHSYAVHKDGNPEPVTSKDASKLFINPQKFYLLYRSEKSDTKLGGESKCFQMKYYEAHREKNEYLTELLFRDNSTGQMDVYLFYVDSGGKQQPLHCIHCCFILSRAFDCAIATLHEMSHRPISQICKVLDKHSF
uniref:Putative salivary lipocalin n=1 Tax=Ixodes ricinus TaxID=34613 RepID=A0A0K8RA05_IXORI